MIRFGICDDDKYALKLNEVYIYEILKEINRTVELKSFLLGNDLVEYATANLLDAVFLDIDLKDSNGIEIAKKLKSINKNIYIIFMTGHREFALDAFDIDASGYIVKPIEVETLKRNIIKVCNLIVLGRKKQVSTLTFTEFNIKQKIIQNKILYAEKTGNKTVLYTVDNRHSFYEAISVLITRLDENFIQASQSLVVNLDYIEKIEKNQIILKDGKEFSIGRKFQKKVKQIFFNSNQLFNIP